MAPQLQAGHTLVALAAPCAGLSVSKGLCTAAAALWLFGLHALAYTRQIPAQQQQQQLTVQRWSKHPAASSRLSSHGAGAVSSSSCSSRCKRSVTNCSSSRRCKRSGSTRGGPPKQHAYLHTTAADKPMHAEHPGSATLVLSWLTKAACTGCLTGPYLQQHDSRTPLLPPTAWPTVLVGTSQASSCRLAPAAAAAVAASPDKGCPVAAHRSAGTSAAAVLCNYQTATAAWGSFAVGVQLVQQSSLKRPAAV